METRPFISSGENLRLNYLDWLRVFAIFGVFLYHAVHPFDTLYWHVKNVEQSELLSAVIVLFGLWGMPLFFFIAGTGTYFALKKRTSQQFVVERFNRLMIPFIFGVILFSPIMLYLNWYHDFSKGLIDISFIDFVLNRNSGFSPQWFGVLGFHLWFLGFLFSFSVLALPFFIWMRKGSGMRVFSQIAKFCEYRGGIMILVIPFLIVKIVFQPFFPSEHDWADFFFLLSFFTLGYILFTDNRFLKAIKRDWQILFTSAILTTLILIITMLIGDPFAWVENPFIIEFYIIFGLVTINAFSWTLFTLYIGMNFMNFTNKLLEYCKEAVLPFFVVHQPIIIIIAFFVVQWDLSLVIKLIIVVTSSFIGSILSYEIIKRIKIIRLLFGMKTTQHYIMTPQ